MAELYVGVDGGGTSCRAAIAGADAVVRGEGRSGAANILTDLDGTIRNIIEAAHMACRAAGVDPAMLESADAVLGLAGANIATTLSEACAALPFRRSTIETDALIATHGALAGDDGAVAILGTGSVFGEKRGDLVRTIGGWGFTVGDQGAGAALGRALLSEALLVHDGVRAGAPLATRVLNEFDDTPEAISAFAHTAVPGDFARYAPLIFRFADEGDAVALRILKAAAAEVDEALDVVLSGEADRLCLLGGLGSLYRPWLATHHQRRVSPPAGDALSGAVGLAIQRFSRGGVGDG